MPTSIGLPGVRDVERRDAARFGEATDVLELRDRKRGPERLGLGGVVRDDGDRERPAHGGCACLGVDEVVQAAPGTEPAPVPARRHDAAVVELQCRKARPGVAGIRDGHAPRVAVLRPAPEREVASEVGEPADHLRPGEPHRLEGAGR